MHAVHQSTCTMVTMPTYASPSLHLQLSAVFFSEPLLLSNNVTEKIREFSKVPHPLPAPPECVKIS